MSRAQLLLCLFGLLATALANQAAARSAGTAGAAGGFNAGGAQFSHQVVLETRGQPICAGSLLSERFVITAAHCVTDDDGSIAANPMKAVAQASSPGANSAQRSAAGANQSGANSAQRAAADVTEVFVPKAFDSANQHQRQAADVAILKLNKAFDIENNPNFAKVGFPAQNSEVAKRAASGFASKSAALKVNPATGEAQEAGDMSFEKMRASMFADFINKVVSGQPDSSIRAAALENDA